MAGPSRLVPWLIGAVLGVAGVAAQDAPRAPQTPTFRADIEYVEVDATVLDADGRFVRGLAERDFQIFEDGRPQTISGFSLVDLPVVREDRPLYSAEPFEPDVVSNERPFDGRIFVLVLDGLHTGFARAERAKAIAREFIARLGPTDLMAVVHTVGGRNQEFTSNKRLLVAAVDHTTGLKLPSAIANKVEDYFVKTRLGVDIRLDPPIDKDDRQRAQNARSALKVLEDVSRRIAAMRGRRKAMVWVGEGIDYDVDDVMSVEPTNVQHHAGVHDVLDAIRTAVAAAARANVLVYAIDPRGMSAAGDDTDISGFPMEAAQLRLDASAVRQELRRAQDSLRNVSAQTGGFAITNTEGFAAGFERIVEENSSYYLLAYYPTSPKRDGTFHRIDVKVNRPGVVVRARSGYTASPEAAPVAPPTHEIFKTASREVVDTLNSLLPVTNGVRMQVAVASFRDAPPDASILVATEIAAADLRAAPGSGLELVYIAVDDQGKIRAAAADRLPENLRPEVRTAVERTGVRFLNRLRVPPGRYQVRIAARQTAGRGTGSLVYDIEVPDYNRLPLSMSGIVLTSGAGGGTMTMRPDAALRTVLTTPPAAARGFPQNDELAVFAEIYDMSPSTPHRVDIVATVTTDTGVVAAKTAQERASSELGSQGGAYGFVARIPLSDLVPGAYVLTLEARSRLSGNPTVARRLRFHVVPGR